MPVITVVRHGPTAFNDEDRLRGWMDPPLTDAGLELAKRIAVPNGPVYSSDLQRAMQTASALGGGIPTPQLRPWHVGIYAGQPGAIVHPKLVQFQKSNERVPMGERWSDFEQRLIGFVSMLRTGCTLVTHFRCCKVLLAWRDGGYKKLNTETLFSDNVKVGEVLTFDVP